MKERLGSLARSRPARGFALLAAAASLAAIGTVIGWRLAGPTEHETALGRVSFSVAAHAWGEVDAFVPIADWGLRSDSFDAPFRLEVEVRAVDRRGALEAAAGGREAINGLEAALETAARESVVRAFIWGLAAALILASLVWVAGRRSARVRLVAYLAAALAVLGSGASLVAAAATFDSKAFTSPSYYGRGEELAQLLEFFERQRDNDRYTSTFDQALTNFSAYLSDTPRIGEGPGTTILFGSDLHNNAPILSVLADFTDEDEPVFLAGDFAHYGNETEARLIAPRIAALTDRVVAVSGNHDSRGLMRALAKAGVTVLDQQGRLKADGRIAGSPLLRVGQLEVAGFSDPLEWQGEDPDSADRIFSFPELEDGDQAEQEAKAELVEWFATLPRTPDIVLVHQNPLAQHLASELSGSGHDQPLTILTGHNHYQHIDRYDEITVVNAGTVGAGGVLRVGQEPAGLGELHLQGAGPTLRSVDLIRIEPFSGQAEAERVVLNVVCPLQEADGEPCHYEP